MTDVVIRDWSNSSDVYKELYRFRVDDHGDLDGTKELIHLFAQATSKNLAKKANTRRRFKIVIDLFVGSGSVHSGEITLFIRIDERHAATETQWRVLPIPPEEVEEFVNAVAEKFAVPETADAR